MGKQLDLFDWRQPCRVMAFPHARLIGRARRLVGLRETTGAAEMDRIWDSELWDLERAMIAAGVPDAEQDAQLQAFADLVRAEILRADYGGRRHVSSNDAA